MLTTIVLISLFTILCIALSDDRAWDNVTRTVRNDLVFADRNREYGAYQLRREYDNRFVIALFTALGLMGAVFGVAYALSGKDIVIARDNGGIVIDLTPPIEMTAPAPDPPAPKQHTTPTPPIPTPQPSPIGPVEAVDTVTITPLIKDTSTLVVKDPGPIGGGTPEPGPGGSPVGGGGGSTLTSFPGPVDIVHVEDMPEFPGGEAAMYRWLKDRIVFPDTELGSDRVYVQFVIHSDGSIRDVKAVKGKHREYMDEAERVVKRMPKWKAARMNKHDVPCRLVLPISFEVRN